MAGIAAAFVVLAGAAFSWGTLCLGEDGHVALEASVAGRCLDEPGATPPAEHPVHLAACEHEAGCGPCTDLRGLDEWLKGGSAEPTEVGVAPLLGFHPAAPQPATLVAHSRSGEIIISARHAAATTTVLRC